MERGAQWKEDRREERSMEYKGQKGKKKIWCEDIIFCCLAKVCMKLQGQSVLLRRKKRHGHLFVDPSSPRTWGLLETSGQTMTTERLRIFFLKERKIEINHPREEVFKRIRSWTGPGGELRETLEFVLIKCWCVINLGLSNTWFCGGELALNKTMSYLSTLLKNQQSAELYCPTCWPQITCPPRSVWLRPSCKVKCECGGLKRFKCESLPFVWFLK